MSKTYEERTETRRVCAAVHCDVCKQEIKDPEGPIYTDVEVSVSHVERRMSYGDVLETKSLDLDVCGFCFRNKISPFLASLGVDVTYQED